MMMVMIMFRTVSKVAEVPPRLCQSVPISADSKHEALFSTPTCLSQTHIPCLVKEIAVARNKQRF